MEYVSASINRIGDGVYDLFMLTDLDRLMIPESYQLAIEVLREEFEIEAGFGDIAKSTQKDGGK